MAYRKQFLSCNTITLVDLLTGPVVAKNSLLWKSSQTNQLICLQASPCYPWQMDWSLETTACAPQRDVHNELHTSTQFDPAQHHTPGQSR
jgi:hypothetical protein